LLVNEDYQVAVMNDDSLETFHSLPYGGKEGFLADLIAENNPDDLHSDDVECLLNLADSSGAIYQGLYQSSRPEAAQRPGPRQQRQR